MNMFTHRWSLIAVMTAWAALAPAQPTSDTSSSTTPASSAQSTDDDAATEKLLAQGATTFAADAKSALEVKRAPTGHLLVRPQINGKQPGWFIFDTGAGVCVISTRMVDGLALRDTGAIPATGVGGSKEAKLYRAESLTLGPATFQDHPLMATDLSFLKQYLGDDIAGVIGYGVLSRCVSEITIGDGDHAPAVALFDPSTFDLQKQHPHADARWAELKIVERVPAIAGKIEDHDAWFRLDTGANGTITVHKPAVDKWDLLDGRTSTDIKLGGVGGFVAGKSALLRSVELAGVRRENVKASFAVESKGSFANPNFDGNVGAELLRPFTIVLDYTRAQSAFVPRER